MAALSTRRTRSNRSSLKLPSTAIARSRRSFFEPLEDRRLLAAVATDKHDYLPGETALISATDFAVGESVKFQVLHIDGTPNTGNGHDPWTVTDGGTGDLDGRLDGNISTSWYVDPDDSAGALFELTALGLSSGLQASATFTDAAPPSNENLFQWDPPGWVTGNNDGPYFEGDTVPYYTNFNNLVVGDTYSITIEWDTTKSGKHAIDYLGSYNTTIAFPPAVDPAVQAGVNVVTTDTIPIPIDTFMTSHPDFDGVQQPGTFKMYNGDMIAVSPYNTPLAYLGDTSTSITITFVAQDDDGDASTTTSSVVLTWGGHIASRQDWGLFNSAVDIPGSPYHMRLDSFFDVTNNEELGLGNTDRSLSAQAVIFPAIITIIKDALPDDGQDFAFTTTGAGLTNFTLDDDGTNSNPLSNSQQFSVTDFTTKTITEALVAGWDLTAIEITEVGGTANSTFDLATRTATLDVEEGEIITVKFTNNQQGRIIIEKQTLPDGSAQSFEFDPSYSGSNFLLTDGQQNDSGFLAPGTYSIAEVNLPSGWTLSSAVCSDGSPANAISLQAGEVVTCVFTNTQQSRIIVEKQTLPDGSAQSFEFDPSYSGSNFLLTDGQQNNSGFLAPGTYSVAEVNIPAGWTLSSAVCSDGSPANAISLQPGEVVTCVFTNTQQSRIIVEKQTLPDGSAQSFEFDPSYASNFLLTDGQQNNSGFLAPGTYSVAEVNIPAGWTLSSAVCSDGSPVNAISLQPGEVVTCVFTNTQQSQIIVQKQTLPDGSTQSFEFDPSYASNFLLTDGQQNNSGFLAPGTYSVAEVNIPSGWTLSSAVCSDGSPANAISLQPGEVVTCVFTNTQQSQIIVQKQTLPDGSAQSFEFDPSYAGNFFLTDGQSNNSGFLAPGTYSVAEVNIPAGWTPSSAVCSDGSPVNAISLQPGEVVTCVFTNTQQSQIIVQKQTLPDGSAQSFEFDPSYSGSNFFLTDGQQNNSGFLAPGTYSVAEVNIPAGWTLSSAVCSDGSPVNAISLQPGEVVTCVFTNTLQSQIIVQKQTLPDGSAQSFEFDPSYAGNFFLTDGQQNSSGFLAPGTYSVAEVNIPSGWTLSSAVCSDGSPVNAISLQPGEIVTCVFTNTQQGQIIVEKQTLPDGSAQSFEFDPSYAGNFFLTDGQQNNSGFLAPGTYSVFEVNVPSGWNLSSAVCSDGSPVGAISLQPGEVVTCVFTNTQQGQIIVEKQTLPDGSAQSFEFDPSYAANFFLTDGQQNNSGFLAPGTYSVAEVNIPSGWTLSSAVCSDGSPANAISLQPGETVTCIFTNTQQGQIIVQKQTLPDGSAQSFEFDPSYAANFFLTDGQQNNSGFLAPGIYSVAEVNIPSGWTLSSAVCSDGSPVSAVSLQPGEIVTCVFTNTQKNEIIVIGPDKSPTVPAPVLIVDKDTGAIVNSFLAYEPTFVGGTRVATGDLTGDGIDEIITAPGRGRAPEVRVFTQAGVELPQFRTLAYAATYVGGVHVAVGDVNGDGLNDIITSPSSGKVLVKVFLNQIPNVDPIANVPFKSFYAFPTTFVGGGFVRAADMGLRLGSGTFVNTLDGKAEIIVGSGPGIKAAVKVFHVNGTPTAVRTVFPFSTASSVYKNGVNLDVARLNADLIPDIIVGTENGGNSRVETFVWNGSAALVKTGSFMAYGDSPSKIAPVRVAALDASGDGIADKLATVQGPGGTTQQIRCFDIVSPSPLSVTQTAALGGFPGPYWIAALDSPAPPQQPIEAEGEADFEASALSVTSAPNLDVNGDGAVTAQDALLVVNGLNQQSAGTSLTTEQVKALDVSGDGQLTALDALLLVNELNRTAAAVAALAPAISSATSSSQSDESRFTAEVDELFALL